MDTKSKTAGRAESENRRPVVTPESYPTERSSFPPVGEKLGSSAIGLESQAECSNWRPPSPDDRRVEKGEFRPDVARVGRTSLTTDPADPRPVTPKGLIALLTGPACSGAADHATLGGFRRSCCQQGLWRSPAANSPVFPWVCGASPHSTDSDTGARRASDSDRFGISAQPVGPSRSFRRWQPICILAPLQRAVNDHEHLVVHRPVGAVDLPVRRRGMSPRSRPGFGWKTRPCFDKGGPVG